jgi:hypothetical protein
MVSCESDQHAHYAAAIITADVVDKQIHILCDNPVFGEAAAKFLL